MILHNTFQVLFSIWLIFMGLNIIIKMFSDGYNSSYDTEIKYAVWLTGGWWYFFGKLTELLDTIQFGIWLIYEILIIIFPITLVMECRAPKFLIYFFILKAIIFIYLFSDFYQKRYKTKTI
ncbi:uncharacterized protein [Anoplolepis gracilipes]|uniref:uncharacterized protein n=1 Tax=Anoplolepis gracilipes TaxID=354296 RepID=UPI003BA38B26